MNTYKHLTLCEREKIMVFHALSKTITQIAQQLQRHKSTISRELRRCQGEYAALSAQEHYQQQRVECKPKRKLADPKLFDFVKQKFLQENWSPEQIASRLKYEQSTFSISFVSIYRGIYAGLFDEKGLSHGARGAIFSEAQIQAVVDKLTHRPRKCLNWKTPYEVYFDKVLQLV